MTQEEDGDVRWQNKPGGLAVQGGAGITRKVGDMLEVTRDAKGQKPRLVHRLEKETSGCLLIAKTRFGATALTGSFRVTTTPLITAKEMDAGAKKMPSYRAPGT